LKDPEVDHEVGGQRTHLNVLVGDDSGGGKKDYFLYFLGSAGGDASGLVG